MIPTRPPAIGSAVHRALILVLAMALPFPVGAQQRSREDLCVRPVLLDAADPLRGVGRTAASRGESEGPLAMVGEGGDLCRTLNPDPRIQEPEPAFLSPGRASLFSALLPGMGQRYLGQDRWIAYLGIEAWAWVQFFAERAEGNALQREYRDLAWSVARRVSSGARVDGDFEYYESLTKFGESGAWDSDPVRPGVQPETDAETFNGSVWELARDIFFPSDAEGPITEDSQPYQNALEYYQERGVTPNFTWSWRENELQQAVYGDVIQQSDETLRNALQAVLAQR